MRTTTHRARFGRRGLVAGLTVAALTVTACGSSDEPAAGTSADAATTAEASSAAPDSSAGTDDTAEATAEETGEETSGGGGGTGGTLENLPAAADCTDPAGSADAATATSMEDFGGACGLIAAANAEGALNVIALPPDWANYGEVIALFQSKYPDITLDQQNPAASSADEIAAADTNKGTDKAPDVFDLGSSVALSSTSYFAPYQVAGWDSIPDENKEPTGLWVNDYTGIMAVGYDPDMAGEITDLQGLLNPDLKGVVALNGDPTKAGAAFSGVVMSALANGGSLDDIAPGVEFWGEVAKAGNMFKGDATPATVEAGETQVLVDWTYNQVGYKAGLEKVGGSWDMFVPEGAELGSFYVQAISSDAPNPAAARLWQEFLYTPEAQNLWVKGGAIPVLFQAMLDGGSMDEAAWEALGVESAPQVMTPEQTDAANAYLAENWAKAIG